MATLFDLAQQYLNRALPETFKYDRTPPIGTNPPGLFPQPPVKPVEKILPRPGGNEEGFSVYNPDPNRTRNESNYNPRTYNKVMRDTDKFGETVMPNPDLYYQRPLEGIPGMVQGYMKNSIPGQLIGKAVSGIESLLPVNRRAIYENELLGQGIKLDDIGRIVSDGGNINTAENIMAGYNANKVTAETFQKRRDMINAKMKDPVQKAAKLAALDAAEEKMLGTAKTRADMVFEDKMITKDPSLKGPGYLEDAFDFTTEEDNESEIPSFIIDNNIIGPGKGINAYPGMGIASTYTPSPGDLGYIAPTAPITSGSVLADRNINRIIDDVDIPGGQDNDGPITTAPKKTSQGLTTSQFQAFKGSSKTPSSGTGSGGLGDYQIQPTKPTKSLKTTKPGTGGGADSGGSSSGGGKIVCTMMNESYGFGSFRNKIWLKHSKGLAPEYQKGYHKLFLPLVKIAKTNKVVRKILEHIAVHRTIDIRQESRGKIHLLGRVYRKILEPLCYFVGKHG